MRSSTRLPHEYVALAAWRNSKSVPILQGQLTERLLLMLPRFFSAIFQEVLLDIDISGWYVVESHLIQQGRLCSSFRHGLSSSTRPSAARESHRYHAYPHSNGRRQCAETPNPRSADTPRAASQALQLRALVDGKDVLQKKTDDAAKYLQILSGKEVPSRPDSASTACAVRGAQRMDVNERRACRSVGSIARRRRSPPPPHLTPSAASAASGQVGAGEFEPGAGGGDGHHRLLEPHPVGRHPRTYPSPQPPQHHRPCPLTPPRRLPQGARPVPSFLLPPFISSCSTPSISLALSLSLSLPLSQVHIRSDLQEISRNIDTMALAKAPPPPPIPSSHAAVPEGPWDGCVRTARPPRGARPAQPPHARTARVGSVLCA